MTDLDSPDIGLGTSGNDDPEECAESVATALNRGYRHVERLSDIDRERRIIDPSDAPWNR